MVRALLNGRKTQTRRAMSRQKKYEFTDYTLFGQRGHADDEAERRGGWAQPWVAVEHAPDWPDGKEDQCQCPYAAQRGDRLWVRETFYAWGHWTKKYNPKKRKQEWHFVDETIGTGKCYRYDAEEKLPRRKRELHEVGWWKRPAIFMPRHASRITLEVTGLRVEQLNYICVSDAIAEGCPGGDHGDRYAAVEQYRALWESINGNGSWNANPWVWVIEFKRVVAA